MLVGIAGVISAQAQTLELTATADKTDILTGESYLYTFKYKCASTTNNCTGVTLTATIPDNATFPVQTVGLPSDVQSYLISPDRKTITFTFKEPLTAGNTGIIEVAAQGSFGVANNSVATLTGVLASGGVPGSTQTVNTTVHSADKFCPQMTSASGFALDNPTSYSSRLQFAGNGYSTNGYGTQSPGPITFEQQFPAGTVIQSVSLLALDGSPLPAIPANAYTITGTTVTVSLPATTMQISGRNAPIIEIRVNVVYPSSVFATGDNVTSAVTVTYQPDGVAAPIVVTNGNTKTYTDGTSYASPTTGTCTNSLSTTNPLLAPSSKILAGKTNNKANIKPGEDGFYNVSLSNLGNTPLTDVVLEDIIPSADITVNSISRPSFTNLVGDETIKLFVKTVNTPTYTEVPAATSYYNPTAGDVITAFKITADKLPAGASTNGGMYVNYILNATTSAASVQNCITVAASNVGLVIDPTTVLCVGFNVQPLDPYSTLKAYKYLSISPNSQYNVFYGGPITRGTTFWSSIGLANLGGGQPLANPVGMDLLPLGLDYDNSIVYVAGTPTADVTDIIPNFNGTGRTLVRLKWNSPLPSGSSYGFAIAVKANSVAPAGLVGSYPYQQIYQSPYTEIGGIKNTVFFTGSSASKCAAPNNYDPVSYWEALDQFDLNSNGVTSETFCYATDYVGITASAQLTSVKWVKGQCDTDYSKYPDFGQTIPGGTANYKLIVTNTGNVATTNIEILDILPFIGDKGVIDPNARLTQWRPNLVTPIQTPAGVTVYYSTATNPCRTDYVPAGPAGCTTANWSTVLPADPTTVQSLKLDFGTKVLKPGDQIELTWDMRAPVGAPTAGEIAWNSFGFKSIRNDNNDPFLASEPFKVGIKLKADVLSSYGDFVWIDANKNGIQDAGETGIDGVRVELHKDNGDNINDPKTDPLVAFTSTANGGLYLFPGLVAGNYYAVFFLPPGYETSPANAATTADKNSDGIAGICNGNRVTITPITSITAGENDLTWDQGIYIAKAAVGNYVWFDENQNNIQDESSANGINGVVVCLYTSTGVFSASTTTTNDVYGRPGYYLFDQLDPGSYYVQFKPTPDKTYTTGSGTAGGSTSDETDSDVDPATGKTAVFTLSAGQVDLTWDAGLIIQTGLYKLGNFVWSDANNNGKFDTGETGINGVTVNLYNDRNNDNKPQADESVTTTITGTVAGIDGVYTFDRLPAGNYIVQIPDANYSGQLKDYVTSTGNDPAPDPDDNVENDDNGSIVVGCGVISKPITLGAVAEPLDAGYTNYTVDFGFYICNKPDYTASVIQPTCAGGTGSIAIADGTIGNKVGYSIGTTFTGSYSAAVAISSLTSGVVVNNIAGTSNDVTYSVRVFNSEEACYQDFSFTIKALSCSVCSLTALATPTVCNSATNQYDVTGSINLTSNTAGGVVTITDGIKSTTVTIAALATSVAYSLSGLTSGTGSHTVTVSLPGCGTAVATYSAPASCTVATPVCSISATAVATCNDNGTLDTNTDDYITFVLTPYSLVQGSRFTLTATQAGSPIAITFPDGTTVTAGASMSALSYTYPTPLRTPVGSAGHGTITLTLTDSNDPSCTTQITVADPGVCAVATCTPGSSQTVSYTYRTPFQTTELTDVPLLLKQFDTGGGSRTLTGVKLTYKVAETTSMLFENSSANANTFKVTVSGDAFIALSGTEIADAVFPPATTGFMTLPAGVTVSPQGTYPGDATYSATNVSTLKGMDPWLSLLLEDVFVDPRLDPRWVATATGNPATDDDIFVWAPQSFSAAGISTYSAPADLAQFVGSGYVPLLASTLNGFSTSGGGGNVLIQQNTKAYACATVEYTYTCAAVLCSLTATATPTVCNSSTNQYEVSGTISLTNNTSGGVATITDGANSTTVTVGASTTSVAYSLSGLTSDGASHTVTVSLPGCGTAVATYSAPASCTVATPVCSISATAVATCNDNGTLDATTDDYITFVLTPYNVVQGSRFTITATQAGSPIAITFPDGTTVTAGASMSALSYAYPTPFRTETGTAGKGNITLTITDVNNATCTTQVTVIDPGTCAPAACVGTTPTSVSYAYQTPFQTTELNNVPLLLNKFDDGGGTRTLTGVKLTYKIFEATNYVFENSAATPNDFEAVIAGNAKLKRSGTTLITAGFPALSTGDVSLPAGITVTAQGTYAGDASYGSGTNVSTLEGMKTWLAPLLTDIYLDPRLDPRWVTTATGDLTTDDDIFAWGPQSFSSTGISSYTAAADLAQFTGSGFVPLTASTLNGISMNGGGGNILSVQNTKAYACATVEYTYICAACSLTATATPTACNSATNQYDVSGTISLTSNLAGGVATITDGTVSTSVTVGASATSIAYSLTGLTSDGANHTVTVTVAGCGSAVATYTAPASCTIAATILVTSATVCYGSSATLVASGCTGTITWSDGTTTGASLVTPVLTTTTDYTATCTTSTGSTTSAVGTVTVMPQPVLSLQASSTLVTVGTPVSLSAIGCVGTVSWSTGETGATISVTPVNPTNVYSATCTTGPGCTTVATTTINTAPSASLVVISATVCYGSSATLVASGCTGTITWSDGTTTGASLVTPVLTTTTDYTATCTTSTGSTTSAVGTVTVMPQPVLSLQASSTLVTVGTPVSLSAIGCVGTVSWSTGETGATISVTPVNPTNVYSATCTTGPGCTTVASTTINTTVACSLSLTTTSLPKGEVGVAYNQTIVTSGGTAPLNFSVSGGSLPTGLSLNATTGIISGTPTVSGSFPTTITVTDAKACQVKLSLSVFQIDLAPLTASLGDFVWYDTNKNGQQDGLETGVAGVIVKLFDPTSSTVTPIASLTTDASGKYLFTNLTPGQYCVVFQTTTLPVGYSLTLANTGADATDSDANPVTGKTATYTLSAGQQELTVDAGIIAPAVSLNLDKLVDKSRAKVGDVLTYTLVLTNTGTVTATNVVVSDVSTVGLRYVAGSASAPAGSTFTQGSPLSTWTIASLGVGQHLDLTFQAIADSSGILYNTATIPGDTARVCTSIPYQVCKGSVYQFQLSVADGSQSYQWYKDDVALTGASSNTLLVTAAGSYSVAINGVAGCLTGSCCPFIIEEIADVASYSLAATTPTCNGTVAQTNGQLTVTGLVSSTATAYTYQIVLGSSFDSGTLLTVNKTAVPLSSILSSSLAPGTYTVRIYNASGCYRDVTAVILPANCGCSPPKCIPFVVQKIRRIRP